VVVASTAEDRDREDEGLVINQRCCW